MWKLYLTIRFFFCGYDWHIIGAKRCRIILCPIKCVCCSAGICERKEQRPGGTPATRRLPHTLRLADLRWLRCLQTASSSRCTLRYPRPSTEPTTGSCLSTWASSFPSITKTRLWTTSSKQPASAWSCTGVTEGQSAHNESKGRDEYSWDVFKTWVQVGWWRKWSSCVW